jgi:RHS repeat-associated protein
MDLGGSAYYYHQNALWSIEAVTNSSGAPVERYAYDAYGYVTVTDGLGNPVPLNSWGTPHSAIANPYTFTGQRLDEETAIYFYRARYYDSIKGRFLERDPAEERDGSNLYEYVMSRPTYFNDPTGKSPAAACAAAAGIGGIIGCGYNCVVTWFSGGSFWDGVQDCVCGALNGAATAGGACIGLHFGRPILGGCIGSLIGSVASTFCNLVGNLIRGVRPALNVVKEAFKAALGTAIGCLGGQALNEAEKRQLTQAVIDFAVIAWQKVIDLI